LLIGVPKNAKRISIQSKGIIGPFSIDFLTIVPISPHFIGTSIILLSGVNIQVGIAILILELWGASLLLWFSVIVVSEVSLGSSFKVIRAFSRALALFTAGVGIFSQGSGVVGCAFIVLLFIFDISDSIFFDEAAEHLIPVLLFLFIVIERARVARIAILSLTSEHFVVKRMEHGFEIILAVFIFFSIASAFFIIIGFISEFFIHSRADDESSSISFMVIKRAFILVILILIMSDNFSRTVGAVAIGAREDFVKADLSKSHHTTSSEAGKRAARTGEFFRDSSVGGRADVSEDIVESIVVPRFFEKFFDLEFFGKEMEIEKKGCSR